MAQAGEKPAPKTKGGAGIVKVFILMGDDAMVGAGDVGPENTPGTLTNVVHKQGKFPHLRDSSGAWAVRQDVRYVHVLNEESKMKVVRNEWLSVGDAAIGPELQFGHLMGDRFEETVLILKACRTGRSLGWDYLPPGSQSFTVNRTTYAGYKDTPMSWAEGTTPKPYTWYGGKQYDIDTANIRKVLSDLGTYCPGSKRYEIAGVVWWQGYKDATSPVYASRYEWNLSQLITSLRATLKTPNAPFVVGTIGIEGRNMGEPSLTILKAQAAVSNPDLHPGFTGTVNTVETRDSWRPPQLSPANAPQLYNRNAETFLDVGQAMGQAMGKLLDSKPR